MDPGFVALIVLIKDFLKGKPFLLGALCVIVVYIAFTVYSNLATQKDKKTHPAWCQPLYTDKSNNTWDYVTVEAETPLSGHTAAGCETFRNQTLQELFQLADKKLTDKGIAPYGNKIAQYFLNPDDPQANLAVYLQNRKIVRINEDIDTISDRYTLTLKLAIKIGSDIDSCLSSEIRMGCLKAACMGILPKLDSQGQKAYISLPQIASWLCSHCPAAFPFTRMPGKGAGYTPADCPNLYFTQGQYQLTGFSKMMLESLSLVLKQQSKQKLQIGFEGFTDPQPINLLNGGIPIADGCRVGGKGQMLSDDPSDASGQTIDHIKTNLELSFARSHSSCAFMEKQLGGLASLSYTGWDIFPQTGDLSQMRTVRIFIKKL